MDLRTLPFLLFAAGCAAPDTTGIKLIGHGGLGPNGDHPMDSEAAVMAALALGLDGVELDVQMTADGVLVAYHALEMSDAGPCTGPVHTHHWSEVEHCTQEGAAIPRLDVLLSTAMARYPNAEFTFDVKLNTKQDWNAYVQQVAFVISELNRDQAVRGHIVVECMATDFLLHMKNTDPSIPLFYYCTDAETGMRTALQHGFKGLTMDVDRITEEEARKLKQEGLQLTVFDVDGRFSQRRAVGLRPQRMQMER